MKKAEITRLHILQKSFELIYVHGYQTTSIDDILATTQVTKGAFYYHFKNKDEMGIAIINELLIPTFETTFIQPLQAPEPPAEIIYDLLYDILMNDDFMKVEHGCPAANLTLEMAPWHVEFTKALNTLSERWRNALTGCISDGKGRGEILPDVNANEVAVFIMSGYWGIRNMGKLTNSKTTYLIYLQQLKIYLNTLV
jgi:TetR/AcrR family transcriptional repressor of nem operon